MSPHRPLTVLLILLALAAVYVLLAARTAGQEKTVPASPDAAQAQPPTKDREVELKQFMRRKLGSCNKVLEGLAVENMTLIREGANELHLLSSAEKWRISNDIMYRQFSGEFQRITRELVRAAEEDNLDRAALKWMDATMSCIECHRFVRGMMVAESAP